MKAEVDLHLKATSMMSQSTRRMYGLLAVSAHSDWNERWRLLETTKKREKKEDEQEGGNPQHSFHVKKRESL